MPNPKQYKTKEAFISACIPIVTKEGTAKDSKQATAICYSMWRNRNKSKANVDALDQTLPESLQIASLDENNGLFANSSLEGCKSSSDDGSNNIHGRRLAGAVGDDVSAFSSEQEQNKGDRAMADINELRKEVDAILAEKDAAKQIEKRIADLESQKASIASEKTQIESEKAKLSETLTASQAEVAKQAEQVKTLAKEKEELAAQVASLTNELTKIRQEQALAVRTNELAAAGLLLPDGDKRVKQCEKIRAMSDEAFAAYKEELSDLTAAIKASSTTTKVETDEEKAAAKAAADKAAADKAAADAEAAAAEKAKASTEVQPPDVSHGEIYQQAVASVSAGVKTDEAMVDTYARM